MDAQVLIDSVDVTAYVISIKRNHNYCSPAQEFVIEMVLNNPYTIDSYNDIVIYEEGTKVLTGYVGKTNKNAPQGTITVLGMDVYKRAIDYFISETYTTTENQTVRYWIELLLDLCGLTATFPDGNGPFVIEDQEIGLDTVDNIVIELAQYAGWYCFVDENGNISFDNMSEADILDSLDEENDILSISYDRSYDKTRNVIKVFGGVDASFGQFEAIFAKEEVELDFLPVDQIAVIGNHLIGSQESAQEFAGALLDEFKRETFVKNVEIIGNPVLQVGHFVTITSDLFTGNALLSAIDSNFNENGYTMNLTLDDLCPRIIAAIDRNETSIYAGTIASGVWVYNRFSQRWTSINTGLADKRINDLSVDGPYFIAATPSGIFTKYGASSWEYEYITITGYPQYGGKLKYPAVYADQDNACVYALITFSGFQNTPHRTYLYSGVYNEIGEEYVWNGIPITLDTDYFTDGRYYFGKDLEGYIDEKYSVVEEYHGPLGVSYSRGSNIANPLGIYLTKNTVVVPNTSRLNLDDFTQVDSLKISPDGSLVALAAKKSTDTQGLLYIFPMNGNSGFSVNHADWGWVNGVCWSPDSQRLLINVNYSGGGNKFYTVRRNGTVIGAVPVNDDYTFEIDWSYDGSQFVYIEWNDDDMVLSDFLGNRTILWDGSSPNNVPKAPKFTYERNSILFTVDSGAPERILEFSLDTLTARILSTLDNTIIDKWATQINNDQYIYVRRDNDSVNVGMLYGTESANLLKSASGDNSQNRWSPDGTKIIYTSRVVSDYYIKTVSPYDIGGSILINGPTLGIPLSTPKYSPSGEKIAFGGDNEGVTNWTSIWICDQDGGNAYRAVSHSELATYLQPYISTSISSLTNTYFEWINNEELVFWFQINLLGAPGDIFQVVVKYHRDDEEYLLLAPSFGEMNTSHRSYNFFNVYSTSDYILVRKELRSGFADSNIDESYILKVATDQNFSYTILVSEPTGTADLSIPSVSPDGSLFAYAQSTDLKIANEIDGSLYASYNPGNATGVGTWTPDSNWVSVTVAGSESMTLVRGTDDTAGDSGWDTGSNPVSFIQPHPKYLGVIAYTTNSEVRLSVRHIHLYYLQDDRHVDHTPLSYPNDLLIYNTNDNDFELIYDDLPFSEVNLDDPRVISVYGGSRGFIYSRDFYDTNTIVAGIKRVYDMTERATSSGVLFMTTASGIYKYDVATQTLTLMNNISTATEILNEEEILYFSVLDDAKTSTDDALNYSDISTGLSSSVITVMRLAETI